MNTGHLNGNGLAELRGYNFQNLASAPSTNLYAGRFYYNTADNTLYVYNGSQWLDALAQGTTYTAGTGISITSNTISVASTVLMNAGAFTNLAILGTASGSASVAIGYQSNTSTASYAIAIGAEAEARGDSSIQLGYGSNLNDMTFYVGFFDTTPVNYELLDGTTGLIPDARISSNIARTSAIPTKISDLTDDTATYPIDKADTLTGLTASISELNIMDGVTVSAANINSVTSKIGLTDLSIASGSTNYLGYDNSTGQFSAKVDTTVTASSNKLITSGAVETAISNALVGGVKYVGTWTATGQTNYSSITLPVKKGYEYLVVGSATITAGGTTIEWNDGDFLMINADVASGGTITNVSKIDNTESTDLVKLNATQTLTNKTIDADDNTIQDLAVSNFKSGVVRTSTDGIRATASASDTALVTEKAIASAFDLRFYTTTNPALTTSGGICTWTVTHNLNKVIGSVLIYEVSTGEKVLYDTTITSANVVTIKILSASNIAAGTYRVVVLG